MEKEKEFILAKDFFDFNKQEHREAIWHYITHGCMDENFINKNNLNRLDVAMAFGHGLLNLCLVHYLSNEFDK